MTAAEWQKEHGAEDSFRAHVLSFGLRVLGRFGSNRGLLLAGAVAYNMLLSIVPLFALVLVGLSHLVDEDRLLRTVEQELRVLAPAVASGLLDNVRSFVQAREVVGWSGLVLAVFFSALAFRALDLALETICGHAHRPLRGRLLGILRPYAYVSVIGLGLLLATVAVSWLEHVEALVPAGLAWVPHLVELVSGGSGAALYVLSLIGQVLLLSSIYRVMPSVHVRVRRALVGGVVATALWELTRRALVWYVAEISIVGALYGSLSTAVIALIGLEIGAAIVLFGAQVIAELDRSEAAGVAWYVDPASVEEGGAIA